MKWIYLRNDDGIPGLPKVITDEEAEAAGLTVLLAGAIEVGAYAAEETHPPVEMKKGKKKNEVNDE